MNSRRNRSEKAFLGAGWAFPFAFGPDGRIATVTYEDDVREAIQILLGTQRGERVMRPEFGAGLRDFLFAPVSTTTMERIRTRVEEALIDFEARIDLEEVSVRPAANTPNQLDIVVRYRVRATNTLHNLVYPFYLEEGSRE